MRKFKVVYMRGGTSKGCLFHKEDLPADRAEWDNIFLQVMGNPDPKQLDGMGSCVSSNNKIVIIWKSEEPNVDIEYLVGQVIVGKNQVDYKSNCGNMTAAVPAYAVEEGMVPIVEPITTVRMLNKNTDKYINVTVPIDPETHTFAQEGDCHIAGIDGTAAELKVNFLDPAGAKTGKLFPTGHHMDTLNIDGKAIETTILDVSNPMVIVKAEDMDLCVRAISVFKCHKACPLTSASAIATAAMLDDTIMGKTIGAQGKNGAVRLGHPSGVMTVYPNLEAKADGTLDLKGVAVQRTARRIMEGVVYVRN